MSYLSDEQIKSQYDDFKVTAIKIYDRTQSDSFSGIIEIDFPKASHPDFNSQIVDGFISYDKEGNRIAFENWFPTEVYNKLCELIRAELKKSQQP